ncbi:hypothetical protein IAT38_001272 [Cryptococcus sp. DSM 104549]
MLPRTAIRRVARSGTAPSLAARHLSVAAARPSPIALGKRPAVPAMFAASTLGASSRQFSWQPWSKPAAPATAEDPLKDSAAAPAPEPILTSAHPDLTSLTQAGAARPVAENASALSESVASDAATSASTSAQPLLSDPSLLPQPPADAVTPTLENLVLHSGKSLEEVLNSSEAIHAAMKFSDLKLIGLDHSWINPSGWARDLFVVIHDVGVPWWGVVILASVGLRLSLFPLTVSSQKHNNRWAGVQHEFVALQEEAKKALQAKDEHLHALVQQKMMTLFREHDVHPMRVLKLPLIQFPLFLVLFNALRGLADLPLPQLKEGGFGWIMDLTATDPYMILPLTSLVFTNLMVQYGSGVATNKASMTEEALIRAGHMKNAVQLVSVLSLYFMCKFPALLLIYWTTSSALTLTQSLCLKNSTVQRMLKIPTEEYDPTDVAKVKPPSYLDTFRLIPQYVKDARAKAIRQAQERYNADASTGRRGVFQERIVENTGVKSEQPAEWVRPAREVIYEVPAQVEERTGESGVETPADKRRRIQEARRKRAGR